MHRVSLFIKGCLSTYGRILVRKSKFTAPIAIVLMVALFVISLKSQKFIKNDYSSMFSQIIPKDSIFLVQYLLGSFVSSNFVASSVFTRPGPVVDFMVDYGTQQPFDTLMIEDMFKFYDYLQVYQNNHICTKKNVPKSRRIPGPHVDKPFREVIATLSYEHDNVTTQFYNIRSVTNCMFDNYTHYTSMSEEEVKERIDDFVGRGEAYSRSYCANRNRRTPWIVADSLSDPVIEDGKIISARGFRFSINTIKTSHCAEAEMCVLEGRPWSCRPQIKSICNYISGIFEDIKNGVFIKAGAVPRAKKIYASADDLYMINSFMTGLDLSSLGWGIIPVLILLFIFMHRAIPFKKEWFLYSRLGLYLWGIFTTCTACLAGAASMAWMDRESTVINAACYLLSLGLSVDDILVLLSQIKHLNLVIDSEEDDNDLDNNELDGSKAHWKAPVKSKAEEQLGRALANCGITIFTTSLTTSLSSWFTTFSRLPALGAFGIQTAVSVTFTWACFTFGWLPILAMHLQRVEARRYDVLLIKSRTTSSKTKTPKISFDALSRYLTRFTTAKWPSMIIVFLTLSASIFGWIFCWKIKFRTNYSILAVPDKAYDSGLRFYDKHYAPHVGIDALAVNIASYPYCDEDCVKVYNGIINSICLVPQVADAIGPVCDYKFQAGAEQEQTSLDAQLEALASLAVKDLASNTSMINSVWEAFKTNQGSVVNGTAQWPIRSGSILAPNPVYKKYKTFSKSSAYIPYNVSSSAYWDVANIQGFHANTDVNILSTVKDLLKCSTTTDSTLKGICVALGLVINTNLDVSISNTVAYRHFYSFKNKLDLATNVVGVRKADPEFVKTIDQLLTVGKAVIARYATDIAVIINEATGSELFNGNTIIRIVDALLDGKTENLLTFSVGPFGDQYFSVLDNNMPRELAAGIGGVLAAFAICVTILFDITLAIIAMLTVILEYGFLIFGLIIFGVNYDVVWLLFMIINSGVIVDHALHVIGEFSNTNRSLPRRKRIYRAFSNLCPALLGGWLTTVMSLIGAVGTNLNLVYKGYISMVVIQVVSFFFSFFFIPALLSIIGPTNMNLQGWYYEIVSVIAHLKNRKQNKQIKQITEIVVQDTNESPEIEDKEVIAE